MNPIKNSKMRLMYPERLIPDLELADVIFFGDSSHLVPELKFFAFKIVKKLGIRDFGIELEEAALEMVQKLDIGTVTNSPEAKGLNFFHIDINDTDSRIRNLALKLPAKHFSESEMLIDRLTASNGAEVLHKVIIKNLDRDIKEADSLLECYRVGTIVHDEMALNLEEKYLELLGFGKNKMAVMVGIAHLDGSDRALDSFFLRNMKKHGIEPKIAQINYVPVQDISELIFAKEDVGGDSKIASISVFIPCKSSKSKIADFQIEGIANKPCPDVKAGGLAMLISVVRNFLRFN